MALLKNSLKNMHAEDSRRLSGIARLYGQAALERFLHSHVMVVGIGGVGSWAAEALVRSGVGRITLVDMDDICISNSNRQLHTDINTIGQLKVSTMATRLRAINPRCEVMEIDDFIDQDNLSEYITSDLDFVIDGIDSFRTKVVLILHCKRNKIPLLVCGGAGGQIEPNLIQTADITRAFNDPLLAKIRAELRQKHNFSRNPKRKWALPCVFSEEVLIYPQPDGSVCAQKSESNGKMDCNSGFGAATMVTGSFGFHAASFVLKKLAARV